MPTLFFVESADPVWPVVKGTWQAWQTKKTRTFCTIACVRHTIATQLGLLIEDIRANFAAIFFSDSVNSLAVWGVKSSRVMSKFFSAYNLVSSTPKATKLWISWLHLGVDEQYKFRRNRHGSHPHEVKILSRCVIFTDLEGVIIIITVNLYSAFL